MNDPILPTMLRHYGAEDVIHALETALVMVSRHNARLLEENIMLTKLATDLTAAVDNAIAKGGGVASEDATSIAADTARLNSAFSGVAGQPGPFTSIGAIATSIDQDAGNGPFVLSGLDPAAFSVGMGPLVSAASLTSAVDPGTFSVDSIDVANRTVTVSTKDGWKPIANHIVGRTTAAPATLATLLGFTGANPNFLLSVSDVSQVRVNQTLASKASASSPKDAGSLTVTGVSPAGQPAVLTVVATADWSPVVQHVLVAA